MADLPERRTCGSHDVHMALLRTNVDYARARMSIESRARDFTTESAAARVARVGPTVIPVVVHVIHRGGPENISDAQIKSQMHVLNRDFRKENTDIGSVPAPFKPLAADAMVEFALAKRDPDGAVTNGITRTITDVTQFTTDNAMKFTSQGGHDAWDSARFLNMWVCPEIFDRG